MKKLSIMLFCVALLLLSFVLTRNNGLVALWQQHQPSEAIPVNLTGSRLTLSLENAASEGGRVSIIVNEKAIGTFASGPVTILVYDQDEIQIDSDLPQKVLVTVERVGPEIIVPRAGDYVHVQNTVETLGRIVIRQ